MLYTYVYMISNLLTFVFSQKKKHKILLTSMLALKNIMDRKNMISKILPTPKLAKEKYYEQKN